MFRRGKTAKRLLLITQLETGSEYNERVHREVVHL